MLGTILLALAAMLATVLGTGVYLVKTKNQKFRAWALRRQADLERQGMKLDPKTKQRLESFKAMDTSPAQTTTARAGVNKFGIPTGNRSTPAPKKLSRKQAKAAANSVRTT